MTTGVGKFMTLMVIQKHMTYIVSRDLLVITSALVHFVSIFAVVTLMLTTLVPIPRSCPSIVSLVPPICGPFVGNMPLITGFFQQNKRIASLNVTEN